MSVEEILDALENVVLEAPHVPFTNKLMVEEEQITRLLDALRESLPMELRDANRIMTEQQHIIEQAQKEAQKIIEHANQYAAKLTEESVITKQAQEQAAEIIAKAQAEAKRLQKDAMMYAADVFARVENNLEKAAEVVRTARQEIQGKGEELAK